MSGLEIEDFMLLNIWKEQVRSRLGFLKFDAIDTCGQQIFIVDTALCIIGCLTASWASACQITVAYPNCDNENGLWRPCGLSPGEQYYPHPSIDIHQSRGKQSQNWKWQRVSYIVLEIFEFFLFLSLRCNPPFPQVHKADFSLIFLICSYSLGCLGGLVS